MASPLLLIPIFAQLNPVASYLQLNAYVVEKKTEVVALVVENRRARSSKKTSLPNTKKGIKKLANNKKRKKKARRKTARVETRKVVKNKPSTRTLLTESIVYFPYLEPRRNPECSDHTCIWLNEFLVGSEEDQRKNKRQSSAQRLNNLKIASTDEAIESANQSRTETDSAIDCQEMPLLCHEPIDKNDQDRDVVTLLDSATDNELADTRMEYAVDQLDGTLFVNDSIYIMGAYNSLQARENDELKVEVTKYSLGAGVKLSVNEDFGFHSTVSYNHYQIDKQDAIDENNEFTYGYTFSAGAVGYITEDLEIGGDIVYQQFDFKGDPNTDAKYYFSTRYRLFKSAWLSYNVSANAEVAHVLELRFEF